MATENATKLMTKLKGNEALKAKFQAAGQAGFEALAKAEGLPCTATEFHATLRQMAVKTNLKREIDKVAIIAVVSVAVV